MSFTGSLRLLLLLPALALLAACGGGGGGGGGDGSPSNPDSNTWTWVGGSDTVGASAIYGTPGTADAANVPGVRESAAAWTDSAGNRWLFGGFGKDGAGNYGYLNDLWKYSATTGQWTWMGGSSTNSAHGVYGTQGTADAANVPGARDYADAWSDSAGNLWLFGGLGKDSAGSQGNLNDLWKYSISANQWTWMGGSDTRAAAGVYGTQGTADAANVPGARNSAVAWSDSAGNRWLFGGYGCDSAGNQNDLNDLWKYSATTGQWTWMGGSNTAAASGVYGTQGTADAANVPGARDSAVAWSDSAGNLWLFGGAGYASAGSQGNLNDLWKYSTATGQWTWMGGSNTADASGVYGTQGTTDAANVPGARDSAVAWSDSAGNLWLFGGEGWDGNGNYGALNDRWKYSKSTGQWTWMGGADTGDASGVYGTQGTADAANVPGARWSATVWRDSAGNLWLLGGYGVDSAGHKSYLNDLWMYQP